jgi:hypothetical protein
MKLFQSTTFQFCFIVLAVSGVAAGFTDDLTWKDWLKEAVYFVGIYAGKEGIKYGASAYEGKSG